MSRMTWHGSVRNFWSVILQTWLLGCAKDLLLSGRPHGCAGAGKVETEKEVARRHTGAREHLDCESDQHGCACRTLACSNPQAPGKVTEAPPIS